MKNLRNQNIINVIFLLAVMSFTSCMKDSDKDLAKAASSDPSQVTAKSLIVTKNGLSQESVVIKTVHGNITFKLYPKKAPNTVTRIIKLVNDGFYDGLKFHRVVPNFVIQTGDPTGSGRGGSGKKLQAEFNDTQHIKGTVAMARTSDPDSADSQFYIALNTLPHLDGKYSVFGQVVDGLDVLNKIKQGDVIISMVFNK